MRGMWIKLPGCVLRDYSASRAAPQCERAFPVDCIQGGHSGSMGNAGLHLDREANTAHWSKSPWPNSPFGDGQTRFDSPIGNGQTVSVHRMVTARRPFDPV